jgi:oxaloacetate decarboxylase gamma subunit
MDSVNHLFFEAAVLMLVGMLFVYAFLGLLVIVIKSVIAPLANRFPDQVKTARKTNSVVKATGGISPAVVAAISGAVNSYRQQHNINK